MAIFLVCNQESLKITIPVIIKTYKLTLNRKLFFGIIPDLNNPVR